MNDWTAERRIARLAEVIGTEVKKSDVSAEDKGRIERAVMRIGGPRRSQVFHRSLSDACAQEGWPLEHPMTIWTVAMYANVFPVQRLRGDARAVEGPIHFTGPDFALTNSKLDLFWGDAVLVALALKRRDAPGVDKMLYRRDGAGPYDRA